MTLVGKKIMVLGHRLHWKQLFSTTGAKDDSVMAMSRKGLNYNYPENSHIYWLVGYILTPQK